MSDDAHRPYPTSLETALGSLNEALAAHNNWLNALDGVAHGEATAIRHLGERMARLENIVSEILRKLAAGDDGWRMH
jgi:hypothetical protein